MVAMTQALPPSADIRTRIAELQRQANAAESEEARAIALPLLEQLRVAESALAKHAADERAAAEQKRLDAIAGLNERVASLRERVRANNAKIMDDLARFSEVEALAKSILDAATATISDNESILAEHAALTKEAANLSGQVEALGECRANNWRLLVIHYAAIGLRRGANGGHSCLTPVAARAAIIPHQDIPR